MKAQNILDFWFNEKNEPNWYTKNPDFDQEIKEKFGELYEQAKAGMGVDWDETPTGILAAVILFDQFPRNMFRNTPKAFSTDALALQYAKKAIQLGFDAQLTPEQNQFLYMPFMHSEDKATQEESVTLFEALNCPENLKFAVAHKEIIARFGRYPHRNNILGRESTPEEIEFLKQPGSSF